MELVLAGGALFGGSPKMDIRTPAGIRIGDPLAKVLTAYGPNAEKRIDIYDTTVVTVDSGDGTALRFDSLTGATVGSMEAELSTTVDYTELCG